MSEPQQDDKPALMAEWYENYYECPECAAAWSDEWSCMCDDRCPECDTEYTPVRSVNLSKPVTEEDYLGAARLITDSLSASASEATDEETIAYAEALLEGGGDRFLELMQEAEFIRRLCEKPRSENQQQASR